MKLDSDKKAKMASSSEVAFRVCATASATGAYIRERFEEFHDVYPDIFVTESEKEIRFSDTTIYDCVERLAPLKVLDAGVESVSVAFQVLRSAALKQEEGQYFTPSPVIEAAIKLMPITLRIDIRAMRKRFQSGRSFIFLVLIRMLLVLS